MCLKTCTISQLFCIVCTIIELTNSQPQSPILPFNYNLQERSQLRGSEIMSNVHGMKQIRPINNFGYLPQLPNFYQQQYMPTSQFLMPFNSANQFNIQQQQQQFPFQKQQRFFYS